MLIKVRYDFYSRSMVLVGEYGTIKVPLKDLPKNPSASELEDLYIKRTSESGRSKEV